MRLEITPIRRDGRPAAIYLPGPADKPCQTLYMLSGPEPAVELSAALEKVSASGRPFAAVAVGTNRWNSDYSPWTATPVMAGEPPFTGEADSFLAWLTEEFIPYLEGTLPLIRHPDGRAVLGYSLAGLAALHALYTTSAFTACGCCSGSLWFDGWTDFMTTHRVMPGARIYLSLGKNEEKTKNKRMAAVGEAIRTAHALLSGDEHVADTAFVWNEGGHFSGIPDRMGMAMTWLSR